MTAKTRAQFHFHIDVHFSLRECALFFFRFFFSGLNVCASTENTNLNGWQIAIYRSMVNEAIVKTVAFVDVSDKRPRNTQNVSGKSY